MLTCDLFHTLHYNIHEAEKLYAAHPDQNPPEAAALLLECREIIDDLLIDNPRYSYEEVISLLSSLRKQVKRKEKKARSKNR